MALSDVLMVAFTGLTAIAAVAAIIYAHFAHRASRENRRLVEQSLAKSETSNTLAAEANQKSADANKVSETANLLAIQANDIARRALKLEQDRDRVELAIAVSDDYGGSEARSAYRITVQNHSEKAVPIRAVLLRSSKTGLFIRWSMWDAESCRHIESTTFAPRTAQEFEFLTMLGECDEETLRTLDTISVETQTGECFSNRAERVETFREEAVKMMQFQRSMGTGL